MPTFLRHPETWPTTWDVGSDGEGVEVGREVGGEKKTWKDDGETRQGRVGYVS